MNTYQFNKDNKSVTGISGDNLFLGSIPINHRLFREIEEQVNKGDAQIIPYVPPAPTWEEIRAKRNSLLTASDWSIMADADPKPSKQSWLDYRQALRDIPQTFSSPEEVVFPNKPE